MGELNKNKVDVHNNVFLIATRFYENSYYFPKWILEYLGDSNNDNRT